MIGGRPAEGDVVDLSLVAFSQQRADVAVSDGQTQLLAQDPACCRVHPGDIWLLAGPGHKDLQFFMGRRPVPSDASLLPELLCRFSYSGPNDFGLLPSP